MGKLILIFIVIMFTSCSKVVSVSTKGTHNYYGLNFIDVNTSKQDLIYVKINGFGLVDSLDGYTFGYIDKEQIYLNPKKCQAILIVDNSNVDLNATLELLNNICIIRK